MVEERAVVLRRCSIQYLDDIGSRLLDGQVRQGGVVFLDILRDSITDLGRSNPTCC